MSHSEVWTTCSFSKWILKQKWMQTLCHTTIQNKSLQLSISNKLWWKDPDKNVTCVINLKDKVRSQFIWFSKGTVFISLYSTGQFVFIIEMEYKEDLKQNCELHKHNTRSKYDLHTKSRNTSLLKKSELHMDVGLYKYLILKIKKLDNFNQFRKEVNQLCWKIRFIRLKSFCRLTYCRETAGSCLYLGMIWFFTLQ
jgi:hypothetical protein